MWVRRNLLLGVKGLRDNPSVKPAACQLPFQGSLNVKKPPLKGVTPHGVGRCPQGRGDRSVRGGSPLGGGRIRPRSATSSAIVSKPSGGIRSLHSLSAWGLPTPVVALACIGNVDIRLFFLCKWVTLFHTAFASLSVYRLSCTTDFTRSYASFFLY